jgi:hypothetical protein
MMGSGGKYVDEMASSLLALSFRQKVYIRSGRHDTDILLPQSPVLGFLIA